MENVEKNGKYFFLLIFYAPLAHKVELIEHFPHSCCGQTLPGIKELFLLANTHFSDKISPREKKRVGNSHFKCSNQKILQLQGLIRY